MASTPSAGSVEVAGLAIVVNPAASAREQLAARVLADEVERRCSVRPPVIADPPPVGTWHIALGSADRPPPGVDARVLPWADGADPERTAEGFVAGAETGPCRIIAVGRAEVGCLYAAGRLLRGLECARGSARLTLTAVRGEAPASRLRGHQLGRRPTSNTYDRWGLAEYERYIRDLAAWGCNAVELIPFGGDPSRAQDLEFTVRLAELLDAYGLQVWLWYALDEPVPAGVTGDGLEPGRPACPSRPDGRAWLLAQRAELFQAMPRIDGVFIPGGDPAGCPCERCRPWVSALLSMAEDVARGLHAAHPAAGLWLSNQGLDADSNDAFYACLHREGPAWLAGVVHGPWAPETVPSMRERTPARYAVRQYPDICHTVRCQYPARDWDTALALTLGREPPMWRPTDHAHIARLWQRDTCGAITYSDGATDDLSKAVWSAVLWDPSVTADQVLADYARLHLPGVDPARAARAYLGLERGWQGPLAANPTVRRTLRAWERLEADAAAVRETWRGQMALLSARYTAYVQRKLREDRRAERRVVRALERAAASRDPRTALAKALQGARERSPSPALAAERERLLQHGQALHDLVGMQLSVERWGASGGERGAILDYLAVDLGDVPWMLAELEPALALENPDAVRQAIRRVLDWEDPGPGGFYDDLGDPTRRPHLVLTQDWETDPGYVRAVRTDFRRTEPDSVLRQSWRRTAEALFGTPITVRYTGVDPSARYAVRTTHSGRYRATLVLAAGDHALGDPIAAGDGPLVVERDIPREATANGSLELTWTRTEGRGVQVSEVWLLRRCR